MGDGKDDLAHFVTAQARVWPTVVEELTVGAKRSHWIWFVFPQLAGLGSSPTSVHYAIASRQMARDYLAHPVLGPRLHEATGLMLRHAGRPVDVILGGIDAVKFRSSMTLFADVGGGDPFREAINTFFEGEPDPRTTAMLAR